MFIPGGVAALTRPDVSPPPCPPVPVRLAGVRAEGVGSASWGSHCLPPALCPGFVGHPHRM